jgi:hypothetical protein
MYMSTVELLRTPSQTGPYPAPKGKMRRNNAAYHNNVYNGGSRKGYSDLGLGDVVEASGERR